MSGKRKPPADPLAALKARVGRWAEVMHQLRVLECAIRAAKREGAIHPVNGNNALSGLQCVEADLIDGIPVEDGS